jgi:hypothetical protein
MQSFDILIRIWLVRQDRHTIILRRPSVNHERYVPPSGRRSQFSGKSLRRRLKAAAGPARKSTFNCLIPSYIQEQVIAAHSSE